MRAYDLCAHYQLAENLHDANYSPIMTVAFLTPISFVFRRCTATTTTRTTARRCVVAMTDGGRRNLELNWKYQDPENRRPVNCPSCNGTGKTECQWCNATGMLMLGDALICSIDGQTRCYNCKDGEVECKKCRGHGTIAAWLI